MKTSLVQFPGIASPVKEFGLPRLLARRDLNPPPLSARDHLSEILPRSTVFL